MCAGYSEFDLTVQFRCGASTQYGQWLDTLFEFVPASKLAWNDDYTFTVVHKPKELDMLLRQAQAGGESARIVAGFCWPWSAPDEDGNLPNDVCIGN
jgi:hypothetical protein